MVNIEVFQVSDSPMTVRPASRQRAWFDEFPDNFPYRCLPLVIANQAGLELSMNFAFSVVWDGTPAQSGIKVTSNDRRASTYITGHFGYGVLTFSLPYLFRTPENIGLMAIGPANLPKIGAVAMSGIIETAWSPYTFTMNWKMLEPGRGVMWDKDEPFCQLVPIDLTVIKEVKAVEKPITADPALHKAHAEWSESRRKFNEERKTAPRTPGPSPWQKHYFQGKLLNGAPGVDPEAHMTKTNTEVDKKN